nr:CHAT domain-containing protein [Gammaproteobacteria bacterium]
QPGRFSASLAEHLVEMGVGVVVVAGWAVSDEPARVFAESLYTELLNGEDLATAVRNARHATYNICEPGDVTWGAFQVYGDPGFVLHWAGRRGRGRAAVIPTFVSPTELAEYVSNCRARGRGADDAYREQLREELRQLEQNVPATWAHIGEIWDAFGAAYVGLGSDQEAIKPYERAVATSDANIQAIEQLAVVESRVGEEFVRQGETTDGRRLLRKAERRLEQLLRIAPSAERHALLGSTYKRRAVNEEPKARITGLTKARAAYQRAVDAAPTNLFYPLENKIGLDLLLGEAVSRDELRQVRTSAETSTETWSAASVANVHLLEFLAFGDGALDEAAKQYESALGPRTATSARERDAVLQQIELIANVAKDKNVRQSAAQMLDALTAIG